MRPQTCQALRHRPRLIFKKMDFETVSKISEPALNVLGLGVPAWLVFYPPRKMRARPWWFRGSVAMLAAEAGIYALFYGFVYPAAAAYRSAFEREHPGSALFMDGILMTGPNLWIPLALYTALCLILRSLYLVCVPRLDRAASCRKIRPAA